MHVAASHLARSTVSLSTLKAISNLNEANGCFVSDCMLEQCGDSPFRHGVGMKDFDLLKVLGTGGMKHFKPV